MQIPGLSLLNEEVEKVTIREDQLGRSPWTAAFQADVNNASLVGQSGPSCKLPTNAGIDVTTPVDIVSAEHKGTETQKKQVAYDPLESALVAVSEQSSKARGRIAAPTSSDMSEE
jgi:hypothetical protein